MITRPRFRLLFAVVAACFLSATTGCDGDSADGSTDGASSQIGGTNASGSGGGGGGGDGGGGGSTGGSSDGGRTQGPWQLPMGHFEPATIPLVIVAPRPEITETSRYTKAYPGLPYEVPVAVLGGAWPFHYELTEAPAGMVIGEQYGDTKYGRIVWESPTGEGSQHPVEITVTDQEGAVVTVGFTVTVTTDGFLFVDAANGSNDNDGSLASPFETIAGYYLSDKYDATYQGAFVYYRAGTYRTDVAPLEDDIRLAFIGDAKPLVHLAYPGEEAIIDVRNGHFNLYGEMADAFFGGLVWDQVGNNNLYHAISLDSNSERTVFFGNIFNEPTGGGGIGSNSAVVLVANGGSIGAYWAISHNQFLGGNGCMAAEIYLSSDGVFEGNLLSMGDDGGIYLKNSTPRWSIRNNVGLSGNGSFLARVDAYNGSADVDDVEVCWNNWASSGAGWVLGYEANAYGDFTSYRNTWQVAEHQVINAASANLHVIRDVTQHVGSSPDAIVLESTPVVPVIEEQLAGQSGIVDADGLLVGKFRDEFLGLRGHEVAP